MYPKGSQVILTPFRSLKGKTMRRFLQFFVLTMCMVVAGCSERESQQNILIGGDPALATEQQANEIKSEIELLRKDIHKLYDEVKNSKK